MAIVSRSQNLLRFGSAVLLGAMVAGVALYLGIMRPPTPTASPEIVNFQVPGLDAIAAKYKAAPSAQEPGLATETVKARSQQDIAVTDGWFKKVGFSNDGRRSYDQQYTDEQLKALAEKGDTTAIETLAGRFIDRGQGELAQPFLEKGIIYGSHHSIELMHNRYLASLNSEDSAAERTQKRERLKLFFSYSGLLKLRGVWALYGTGVSEAHELKMFKDYYGENEPLKAEDYQWISNRSQELYEHYEAERHKLGLGDFDNTMPKEVKSFLGR